MCRCFAHKLFDTLFFFFEPQAANLFGTSRGTPSCVYQSNECRSPRPNLRCHNHPTCCTHAPRLLSGPQKLRLFVHDTAAPPERRRPVQSCVATTTRTAAHATTANVQSTAAAFLCPRHHCTTTDSSSSETWPSHFDRETRPSRQRTASGPFPVNFLAQPAKNSKNASSPRR